MPIYHCSVIPISRGKGRSAIAAAAYRSAERLNDERTGLIHDYTRKKGIEFKMLIFPDGEAPIKNREELWNMIEESEVRKNAKVAREIRVALPCELDTKTMQTLTTDFVKSLVEKYKITADVCIHEPNKKGDQRNMHAHILISTREYKDGSFDKKVRVMDDRKQGPKEVEWIRERWADFTNRALEKINVLERVDHSSHRARGIDDVPSQHLGPHATEIERKGRDSDRKIDIERQRDEREKERIELNKLSFVLKRVRQLILQEKLLKKLAEVRKQLERFYLLRKEQGAGLKKLFQKSKAQNLEREIFKLEGWEKRILDRFQKNKIQEHEQYQNSDRNKLIRTQDLKQKNIEISLNQTFL